MPPLSDQPCPLCTSRHSQPFAAPVWKGIALAYRLCSACGLVFQAGSSPGRDPAFYTAQYRALYQGQSEPTAKDLAVQRARAAHLIGFLRQQGVNRVTRWLDFGASAGLLLRAAQAALGCAVAGVEPGDAYRAQAAAAGLEMYASLDELLAKNGPRFDVISLAHVLEHLEDPVGTLRTLRERLLAPDGRLLLEVPNLYAHDSYEVAHLTCFSPHTLAETARRAGYRVLACASHGQPRSRLLPLYTTLLAAPAAAPPGAIRAESGVRWKRRLGMLRRRVVERVLPGLAWLPVAAPEAPR